MRSHTAGSNAFLVLILCVIVGAAVVGTGITVGRGGGPRRDEGLSVRTERFVMRTVGGKDLLACAYLPTDRQPPYRTVVFVHGNLPLGKNTPLYARWCRGLAASGFAVFAFDLRGYGKSGLVTRFDGPDDLDFVADAVAALQWVMNDRRVGTAVAVAGHSSGANVAFAAGSRFERVRYFVLASPGDLDPERETLGLKKHYAWRFSLNLPFKEGGRPVPLPVSEYERLITPLTMRLYTPLGRDRAVLLLSAQNEMRNQIRFAKRLLERVKGPKRHVTVGGCDHCYGYRVVDGGVLEDQAPFDEMLGVTVSWLDDAFADVLHRP